MIILLKNFNIEGTYTCTNKETLLGMLSLIIRLFGYEITEIILNSITYLGI